MRQQLRRHSPSDTQLFRLMPNTNALDQRLDNQGQQKYCALQRLARTRLA